MKKTFTMVELLVVIAVIGILAGILVPVLGNATQKARITQARADINTLMTAMKSYESTYNALPCAYEKDHKTSTRDGEKGFAKEDNYLFWHEYAKNSNSDSKAYDTFVQELSQVDITNKDATDVRERISNPKDPSTSIYNSRGLKLLEVGQHFPEKGFVDPWGNRYAIILNDGYAKNGIIFKRDKGVLDLNPDFEKKKLIGDFFVYSFGPNMVDDYGISPEEGLEPTRGTRDYDDINSWTVQ
ncbi:MAG: type II secretion system protein [Pyramidobacter sp.]|nr:type II secretion system protein [Pyramidobacter sp.]